MPNTCQGQEVMEQLKIGLQTLLRTLRHVLHIQIIAVQYVDIHDIKSSSSTLPSTLTSKGGKDLLDVLNTQTINLRGGIVRESFVHYCRVNTFLQSLELLEKGTTNTWHDSHILICNFLGQMFACALEFPTPIKHLKSLFQVLGIRGNVPEHRIVPTRKSSSHRQVLLRHHLHLENPGSKC